MSKSFVVSVLPGKKNSHTFFVVCVLLFQFFSSCCCSFYYSFVHLLPFIAFYSTWNDVCKFKLNFIVNFSRSLAFFSVVFFFCHLFGKYRYLLNHFYFFLSTILSINKCNKKKKKKWENKWKTNCFLFLIGEVSLEAQCILGGFFGG